MKKILVSLLLVVLVSCSGGRDTPPRNLDNACSIKHARSGWFKDLEKAQEKWGTSVPMMLAVLHQESRFVAKARTPFVYKMGIIPWGRRSSAYGYAQAIDGTWDWYRTDTGRRGAKRDRFGDAVDFMGWYMNETQERTGVSKTDAYNQYLAYHQGHTGYKRGSYRSKSWLTSIASKVSTRAAMYQKQLQNCR